MRFPKLAHILVLIDRLNELKKDAVKTIIWVKPLALAHF